MTQSFFQSILKNSSRPLIEQSNQIFNDPEKPLHGIVDIDRYDDVLIFSRSYDLDSQQNHPKVKLSFTKHVTFSEKVQHKKYRPNQPACSLKNSPNHFQLELTNDSTVE